MISTLVKYVPTWMPGAGFKAKAAHWRRVAENLTNRPFTAVKEALVSRFCCYVKGYY